MKIITIRCGKSIEGACVVNDDASGPLMRQLQERDRLGLYTITCTTADTPRELVDYVREENAANAQETK